jgi:hypothetical protein
MSLRTIFTEPSPPYNPGWRFGMLAVCFAILGIEIYVRSQRSPSSSGDPNTGMVLPLMLLLNHLAYCFRWSTPVAVAFRIAAWAWIIFGSFYSFYWSPRLYPEL